MMSQFYGEEAQYAEPAPAEIGEGDRYVSVLSTGLRAAYSACLSEALPADLAGCLADLVARLDQTTSAPSCDSSLRA